MEGDNMNEEGRPVSRRNKDGKSGLFGIIVIGVILVLIGYVAVQVNTMMNWIRYPWSSLQGKAPPKPRPDLPGPVPVYPKLPLKVLDSGFLADDLENFWWLDNERVMFKGYEADTVDPDWSKKTMKENFASGRPDKPMIGGFYIWDTNKNTIKLYRRDVWNFCYEDGEAYFQKRVENMDNAEYLRGSLGKEKAIQRVSPLPDNRIFKNVPCGAEHYDVLKEVQLNGSWGRLEVAKPTAESVENPILFVPTKGDPVPLPMRRGKWDYGFYAPWRDQYLLVGSGRSTVEMPEVWWLSKDGQSQALVIPKTGYHSASFIPVKGGVLMDGYGRSRIGSPAEMFLLRDDGNVFNFVRPWPQRAHFKKPVSPDGCRVAFRGERCEYPPDDSTPAMIADKKCLTAQMIDFCEKGETK